MWKIELLEFLLLHQPCSLSELIRLFGNEYADNSTFKSIVTSLIREGFLQAYIVDFYMFNRTVRQEKIYVDKLPRDQEAFIELGDKAYGMLMRDGVQTFYETSEFYFSRFSGLYWYGVDLVKRSLLLNKGYVPLANDRPIVFDRYAYRRLEIAIINIGKYMLNHPLNDVKNVNVKLPKEVLLSTTGRTNRIESVEDIVDLVGDLNEKAISKKLRNLVL